MRTFLVSALATSLIFALGCGSSTPKGVPTGTQNVLSIAVDGGPTATQSGGSIYPNGVFASATICAPGSTSNCATVDHLLVDTGSVGLRVLQTAIPSLSLPTVNASNGSAAYDCIAFADLSFIWGPVQSADLTLGGETASKVPIHVIENPTGFSIPTSCSNGHTNEDTQAQLGANGILGVGLEPNDCGSACDPSAGTTPSGDPYYSCPSKGCSPAFVNLPQQVTNPVVLFPTDNNGVIVELPSVSAAAPTVSGSLIFGIGTQSNNQVPNSATVFTLVCDTFTTIFNGQTLGITDTTNCTGPGSFIDTGSNGLFFPDNIPTCPKPDNSFYCPNSMLNLSAINQGTNNTSSTVSFSVDNADNLFKNNPSDAAFSTLAGSNPAGAGFDWGLPFFYGRNVYSAISGQTMPSGLPSAPWWAY